MRYLLDTNIIIWLLADDKRFTPAVDRALNQADAVFYSAASVWEIAIKSGQGKLTVNSGQVIGALEGSFISSLSISPVHTLPVQNLPRIHADPFDRLLIAQAVVERLTLLTSDKLLTRYDSTGRVVRHISDLP